MRTHNPVHILVTALLLMVLIVLSCGDSPVVNVLLDEDAGIPVDTISAVDSIGILMGDSCYTIGAITNFTMFSGAQPVIVDRVKGTVSLFDENGVFVRNYGRQGEGPGEFQHPMSAIKLSSGTVVIIDRYANVNSYDMSGEFLGSWSFSGMGGALLDCIPFDESTMVCYFFSMQRVEEGFSINYSLKRYNAITGEIESEYFNWFGEPSASTDFTPAYLAVASDEEGTMYLSRLQSDVWAVEVYGADPAPVDTILLFADRERTSLSGMGIVPGIMPLQYQIQDGDNFQQAAVNMPEEQPFISALGVDGEGNIWCRRGGLPGDRWDVVSPEGEHLREVLAVLPDSAYYIDMDVTPHGILAFDIFTEDYHKLYIMGE